MAAPVAHALLGASSASRWLKCTPSARLTENIPGKTSTYATEGALAHDLSEQTILLKDKQITKQQYNRVLTAFKKHELFSNEMISYAEDFANYVMGHKAVLQKANPQIAPLLRTETRVAFNQYVPEGFGTCDVILVAGNELHIADLKYGKGVPVYADRNPQLMLYALGALNELGFLYDIETVTMTIFQPRLDNVSTSQIHVKHLLNWAETTLAPTAQLAFDGAGEQVAGEHCKFCKLKPTCRKLAEENLKLAQYDFKPAATLSNGEIADVIKTTDILKDWASSVKDYALEQALQGEIYEGLKVVEGKSNRKYLDETKVEEALVKEGYKEEDIFSKSLLGIKAMEKLLGKNSFDLTLGELVIKPQGSPTLVLETDNRPAYNSPKTDFVPIENDLPF